MWLTDLIESAREREGISEEDVQFLTEKTIERAKRFTKVFASKFRNGDDLVGFAFDEYTDDEEMGPFLKIDRLVNRYLHSCFPEDYFDGATSGAATVAIGAHGRPLDEQIDRTEFERAIKDYIIEDTRMVIYDLMYEQHRGDPETKLNFIKSGVTALVKRAARRAIEPNGSHNTAKQKVMDCARTIGLDNFTFDNADNITHFDYITKGAVASASIDVIKNTADLANFLDKRKAHDISPALETVIEENATEEKESKKSIPPTIPYRGLFKLLAASARTVQLWTTPLAGNMVSFAIDYATQIRNKGKTPKKLEAVNPDILRTDAPEPEPATVAAGDAQRA